MGQRINEGISVNDAVSELTKRRREAQPPARPKPAAEPPAAAEPAARGRTNGQTPPPGDDGRDPIDRLIGAYRDQHAPPAPNGHDGGAPRPAAEPAAPSSTVRLTIDGNAQDFTPDQLTSAVLRANDYTKKTQELAAFTRQVNEQAETINRLLPVLIPEVQRQIAALDEQLGKKVDWQRLAREDPAEYQRQDALFKEAAAERERLANLEAINTQENAAAQAARIRQGHATLVKQIPGWDDPAMRATIQGKMKEWGRQNGFSEQELNNVYEPRHVVALFKALAFDRLMAQVRSQAPVVPQVQGRGRPIQLQQQGAAADAEREFEEKPNVRNATTLLLSRRRAMN
jgi:hypothetical protein